MQVRTAITAVGLTIVLAVAGCDRAASGRAPSDSGGSADGEAMAATTRSASQGAPYTTRPLDGYGKLSGFVELEGQPPPDTVFQPTVDQPVCGAAFTRRGIDRAGNRAIGVVVWIDGLRAGKPLPPDRRFEVLNQNCLMFPEMQAAMAGGTLNVRSLDAAEHRTRITRSGTGEVLATIRETDEGQVVPNEHVLATPGVLRLSCDVHPWTHAWIAVFDHPYFTMTGADGSFAIDSVPPGRYRLRLWHPRLEAVDETVTIEAGKTATLTLRAKSGR
ncbi:MAG TPA: carboxypeptidase regulatory-like domain-containing protein [Gemmatimonadaceae bacterium]|nr:carboxypeptidase regulatory-like domain-containing protein [Gemmatimonadaceae bacterium]